MKKLFLLSIMICCALICNARKNDINNEKDTVQMTRANINIRQQPPVHAGFTDLAIHNLTNGAIPYAVTYADPSKNYQSSITSGERTTITLNQACVLEIPDGKFNLEKNRHYVLYFNNQSNKVSVRQVNPLTD